MSNRIRVTSTARKHAVSRARIYFALGNAAKWAEDGDYALYLGVDADGIELEIGIVPDDRHDGQFAVIHCMPREWRD